MEFTCRCFVLAGLVLLLASPTGSFLLDQLANSTAIGNGDQAMQIFLAEEKVLRMQLDARVSKLEGELSQLKTEFEAQGRELHTLQQSVPNPGVIQVPFVAFQAHTSFKIQNINIHQRIVFDTVDLNHGDGYEPRHGVFTATINGTYAFNVFLGSHTSTLHAELVKNGQNIGVIYTHAFSRDEWGQFSRTVLVDLMIGDDVWVEGYQLDSGSVIPVQSNNTFSGFLLHAS